VVFIFLSWRAEGAPQQLSERYDVSVSGRHRRD